MLGGGAVAPLAYTIKKEGSPMKAEINKEWCYEVIIRIQNEIYNQGMNCKEFAQQINVDRKILIASPNNPMGLNMYNLYKIARALNVSSDYLLGLKEERRL